MGKRKRCETNCRIYVERKLEMDNINYYLQGKHLFLEFTSVKEKHQYVIQLKRDMITYNFEPIQIGFGKENRYLFSLSLEEFVNYYERRIQQNSDETEKELSGYKFTLYAQYLQKNKENDEEILVNKIVRIHNNVTWKLKNLKTVSTENKTAFLPYITKKGGLALLMNQELSNQHYFSKKSIRKLKITENKVEVMGNLTTRCFDIESASIELIERGGESKIDIPVSLKLRKEQKSYEVNRKYIYSFELLIDDFKEYLEQLDRTEELSLDLFFNLKLKETSVGVKTRVGKPRFLTNYFMEGEMATFSSRFNKWLSLVPYFTLKGTNLSFTYNQYEKEAYDYFRKHKNNWKSVYKKGKDKNIWIIGERSYKAQDNGYHFFKYLRIHQPNIDAYYVIKKDSPERENIISLGNVLDFNSKEHFEKVIQAKYICGTHHPDSLYPIRSNSYIKHIKAKKIFLQHGVFGTKNIAPIYAKWVNEFSTDLFITSSEKERQLAITDMGYDESEVVVTGLSRFETLFAKDILQKKQILIIPTWRDWITNNELFEDSEYLTRYRELLFDPRLKQLSEQYQVNLLFCLHPNMQDYVDYFKDAPVEVIEQGERDVQELIKESLVMITDYSSVAFDFSFLHKPVVYYQFDRNRFLGKYPSHLDLDEELPGYITDNREKLINYLFSLAENNFEMQLEYIEKADKFIKYRDQDSNTRIFNAIRQIPDKKSWNKQIKDNLLFIKIQSRFRKSRWYFPTMKFYYALLTHFSKVRPNRILFESGLGKRYEDSPRVIYEKLVEMNAPFEYVWVSNSNHPLKVHPNTKIVKRLSIEYYKYLATSKIWVNNQNLPYYLKKPKDTFYLQTWHGTPLKKMQHDQEKIEGRDEGYLERVSRAKDQWSALLSPSPYATKAFQSAFNYDGEIIESGYPRNDIFYDENIDVKREKVRKKLNIEPGKKVILYAPTFRDNQKVGKKFVMKNKINFRIFNRRLGNDYVLLVREHVLIASKLNIPEEMRESIIDVSRYPDIQELMLASDMLITDYSSVMFDYLNTNKPIYFFCYDLDEYDQIRGFYFNFEEEAPGPIVKNSSNLCRVISESEGYWKKYEEKYHTFQNKFIPLDGANSTEKICQRLIKESKH